MQNEAHTTAAEPGATDAHRAPWPTPCATPLEAALIETLAKLGGAPTAREFALEAALADCLRYIATTYDSEAHVVSFCGCVAPRAEPQCSIAAKRLLGWAPA